jgi:hypothetical protein
VEASEDRDRDFCLFVVLLPWRSEQHSYLLGWRWSSRLHEKHLPQLRVLLASTARPAAAAAAFLLGLQQRAAVDCGPPAEAPVALLLPENEARLPTFAAGPLPPPQVVLGAGLVRDGMRSVGSHNQELTRRCRPERKR